MSLANLNCYGAKLGMTKQQIDALSLTDTVVLYSETTNEAAWIASGKLFEGSKLLLKAGATTEDVEALLGEPESTTFGHAFATVSGMFWHYPKYGLKFTFVRRLHPRPSGAYALFEIRLRSAKKEGA